MAAACPVCNTPVAGAFCLTCGTPMAVGPDAENAAETQTMVAPSAESVDPRPMAMAPPASPRQRTPTQAPAATTRAAAGRPSWLFLVGVAVVVFAAGVGVGYGLPDWLANRSDGFAGEPPLVTASRYLDEGTEQLQKGAPAAAATAFRKAQQAWETALREDPDNHYARTYLGLTQFYLGDRTAAAATTREVLARDPDYLWALFNGAWMAEVTGRVGDAMLYYQHYIDVAAPEQAKTAKYAEQPELIPRQLAAAQEALAKLKGAMSP